ncbi:MAG: serine/threonine protein kinase [Pirellulales bacterium]
MGLLGQLKTLLGTSRLDPTARFELLREAISGTMSSFYMARNRQTGDIVGLKILDAKKTAAFEARFKGLKKPSEGEVATALDHPNIVKTFEHGVTLKEEPYLVMEFLEGPGLNSLLIGRDKFLEGRRLSLIRQAAEAIAAVHKAGYIHRDVCPRNLMLADSRQKVKLIDFGLTVPAIPLFMQPGNRTGTPNYMAPELVRRLRTDQRLDVFAFGVTAFEICTFDLPWHRGATGMAAMQHDTLPAADIRRCRPQIHPKLADAIEWSINPDRNKRCPSIEQFLHAIRDVEHEDQS